ncbi:MAG: amino acid ABC transporter ATP-binding protein [Gulosibacter sp.]|uniref:amino acid ABC transporter ATP-binding protein n=1 Tax=Gulosibacter sp. TaxID=2817531 RepID=UPI003F9193D1
MNEEVQRTATVAPALQTFNLRKSFGANEVLKGIDFQINAGQVTAIIGPSGSGKSTFIRSLNLLETPTSGVIEIGGKPVWTETRKSSATELRALRRQVGMVFQSFNLFPNLTALENISLAQVRALGRNREEADLRSRDLLEKVGLADRANHRPPQLSGGQQQRVAISRALALDPEIMLFGEPTSAIDPELRVDVLKVMRDVAASGVTMIVVTHELAFARNVADRVAFFADGMVLEEGDSATFFDQPAHPRLQKFLEAVMEESL